MTALLMAATLLFDATGFRDALLSDDPGERAPTIAHLRAKGRSGLYAIQDIVTRSTDAATRARAIRALGELGDPAAEWALRLELKQEAPEVQAAAVQAVAKLGLQNLARPMADRVGNPNPALCAALGAAADHFLLIVPAALAALGEADSARQLAGLRVLAAAHQTFPAEVAVKLLTSKLPEARLEAARALAPTDPAAAEATLTELTEGPEPEASEAVIAMGALGQPLMLDRLEKLSLGKFADPAMTALASSPGGLARLLQMRIAAASAEGRGAIDRVLETRPPPPELLLKTLAAGEPHLAEFAASLLARRPDGAKALLTCLQDLGPTAVACAVGLASDKASVAQLRVAMASVNPEIRALAVGALGLGGAAPDGDLLSTAVLDPSPQVRAALTIALSRMGEAGQAMLLVLVKDSDPGVRAAAATQLAQSLAPESLQRLAVQAVNDDAVRPNLVSGLSRLPQAAAINLLLATLRLAKSPEKRIALQALGQYRDPRVYDALMETASRDPDPGNRELASRMLGN